MADLAVDFIQVIGNLSGGAWPSRILATGWAEGGGLAKLAAVWAGAAFPASQIRCIVFGAPRVGNEQCVPSPISLLLWGLPTSTT